MPLFLVFIICVTLKHWTDSSDTMYNIALFWCRWCDIDEGKQLVNVRDVGGFIWEVLFERFKSGQILAISLWDSNLYALHISGSNDPVSECLPA